MSETDHAPDRQSANQPLLIGPTLYLRMAEPEDAATSAIWRSAPFPAPVEVVEEQLKEHFEQDPEHLEENNLFLICTRDDDMPVGSVDVELDGWRIARVRFTPDPLVSVGRQSDIIAEVIEFLVPFLLHERNLMTVGVRMFDRWESATAKILAMGGQERSRIRERFFWNGERVDMPFYQFFNPLWVEKLGEPEPAVFGAVERETRSPARPSLQVGSENRPEGAVMVGERIYLRAVQPEEGKLVARWTREDTEVYYPEGRLLVTAHTFGDFHKKLAAEDYPTWIRFAIVLRESGEMIGCNGLDNISWVHRCAETETEIFRPEHRSAGYGTEAKHLLLEYGFERIGLHMIFSFVAEQNQRSAQALRKQGYRDAGNLAWDSFCTTGLCSYLVFDLLADEWRAARDANLAIAES